MIIMYIGPSSSGKDSFYEWTLNNYKLNEITLLTTRPKREGEIEGKEYYFVSKEEMDKLEKEDNLIERRDYNTKHGIWSYATSKNSIELDKNYLTINTWEGYEKFLEYYGNNIIHPFYFELDKNIRFERAFKREQKQKEKKYLELCRRFLADEIDFKDEYIKKYNPIIIDNNGTKEETEDILRKNLDKLLIKRAN